MTQWILQALPDSLSSRCFPIAKIRFFAQQAFSLQEGQNILGRDANVCHIVLPSTHVSRQHAALSISEEGVEVQDLNSRNGTFVNNERVQRASLKPGDRVRFDSITLVLAHH